VADMVVEVEDDQSDLIHVGRAVSIAARSVRRDDDIDLHIRRHILVRLDGIAIADEGERPVYPEAKITEVRELPARTADAVEYVDTHGAMIRRPCGVVLGVR